MTPVEKLKVSLQNIASALWKSASEVFATKSDTYTRSEVDDKTLIPVDINSLTPSSTFVKGNVARPP